MSTLLLTRESVKTRENSKPELQQKLEQAFKITRNPQDFSPLEHIGARIFIFRNENKIHKYLEQKREFLKSRINYPRLLANVEIGDANAKDLLTELLHENNLPPYYTKDKKLTPRNSFSDLLLSPANHYAQYYDMQMDNLLALAKKEQLLLSKPLENPPETEVKEIVTLLYIRLNAFKKAQKRQAEAISGGNFNSTWMPNYQDARTAKDLATLATVSNPFLKIILKRELSPIGSEFSTAFDYHNNPWLAAAIYMKLIA